MMIFKPDQDIMSGVWSFTGQYELTAYLCYSRAITLLVVSN